nr:reverse transcriptase domain-containing protein [Tanacetum cinerariifolium]
MPPRRLRKKFVKKLVKRRVAKAIEEYEKTRVDSINAASTEGSTDVQGCSYKTFMNCKPHSFNGTEGVVGLKRWFEKMEQVFEICKCTEDDKVKFDMCTLEGHALTKKIEKYVCGFPERIKGNITSSKPATLHDAINMARKLVEQAVQGRATRMDESNKRKWRQETARAYAAAPAEGHFKDKCLKGRNQQNEGARMRAYVVVENPQQNPNVVA